MEKYRLPHVLRTFGGLIGSAWSCVTHLRTAFSSEANLLEHDLQLKLIEGNLELLLRKLQQQCREYEQTGISVDLGLAAESYADYICQWKTHVEQALDIVTRILAEKSFLCDQEVIETHELLRDLHGKQLKPLNDILDGHS